MPITKNTFVIFTIPVFLKPSLTNMPTSSKSRNLFVKVAGGWQHRKRISVLRFCWAPGKSKKKQFRFPDEPVDTRNNAG